MRHTFFLVALFLLLAGSSCEVPSDYQTIPATDSAVEATDKDTSTISDDSNLITEVNIVPESTLEEDNNTNTTEENTNKSILYKDSTFGFSLSLSPEYAEYSIKKQTYPDEKRPNLDATVLSFRIDAKNTGWHEDTFSVFNIIVAKKDWWLKNVNPGDNKASGLAFINGDTSPNGFIGTYLGDNSSYVFAYTRGQDCPNFGATPESVQCSLMKQVPDMLKSLKTF